MIIKITSSELTRNDLKFNGNSSIDHSIKNAHIEFYLKLFQIHHNLN